MAHSPAMTSPVMLCDLDLPLAELHALRLDGELYALDGCFSPIDQPEFPSVRAASLARQWPSRMIVEQRSAAWVHGALDSPPERHQLCVDIGARARPTNLLSAYVREVVIDEQETLRLGGIRVTTPTRTVTDLARFAESFDPGLCRRILRIGRVTPAQAIASIVDRPKLTNKRQALARLRSLS
jgi:hypothetical protein